MGNAWTASYLKVTGDLAVDLHSNIAAENRAKIVYERLISFTQDRGSKEALQFLMSREVVHMRAFTYALDSMNKSQFAVGIIAPTPKLQDQFLNASTGEDQYGFGDYTGPWNNANGLSKVESVTVGGEGRIIDTQIHSVGIGLGKMSRRRTYSEIIPRGVKVLHITTMPIHGKPIAADCVLHDSGDRTADLGTLSESNLT